MPTFGAARTRKLAIKAQPRVPSRISDVLTRAIESTAFAIRWQATYIAPSALESFEYGCQFSAKLTAKTLPQRAHSHDRNVSMVRLKDSGTVEDAIVVQLENRRIVKTALPYVAQYQPTLPQVIQ